MDTPPYTEVERPPTFRLPAPPTVEVRSHRGSPRTIAVVALATAAGGVLGFALPLLVHK